MFVAEKVLLPLVISLIDKADLDRTKTLYNSPGCLGFFDILETDPVRRA